MGKLYTTKRNIAKLLIDDTYSFEASIQNEGLVSWSSNIDSGISGILFITNIDNSISSYMIFGDLIDNIEQYNTYSLDLKVYDTNHSILIDEFTSNDCTFAYDDTGSALMGTIKSFSSIISIKNVICNIKIYGTS